VIRFLATFPILERVCTALLSIEPGLPTLLVGVRDELTDRQWEPPGNHWPDRPDLIGGRDLQAGGTWLAVSPVAGRASCVLNGLGAPAPEAIRLTRGGLPLQAAAGEPLDLTQLGRLDPFHLLTVQADRAVWQSWNGRELSERELAPGLHFAVNSGLASELGPAVQADGTEKVNGRAHELARIAHFLPRLREASRPDPWPGQPVAAAWGQWFALLNGDGIGTDDDRALIVRRDLGGGRIWGTTSISLIALGPSGLRYDFTGRPGDPGAWYAVDLGAVSP
jgi:hypothetical protein